MKHDYAVNRPVIPRAFRHGAAALLLGAMLAASSGVAAAEPGHIPDKQAPNGTVLADKRGNCSAPSRWRLIIRKADSATFGITFKVRGGAPDQLWTIYMTDKGDNFYNGSRISGQNGFFRVRTSAKNLGGTDKFVVGANNSVTGEICRSRASV